MRIKKLLYTKLTGFFDRHYLYSKDGSKEFRGVEIETDESLIWSSITMRFDIDTAEGTRKVCFYHQSHRFITGVDAIDVYFHVDIFSIKLLDQLKYVDLTITSHRDFSDLMNFYQKHYGPILERKLDMVHE